MASKNFMFDIETLDTESSAVVISAAIIQFDFNEKPVYDDLLNRSMFVKFDVEHQVKEFKRTVDKDAVEWWSKQPKLVRNKSMTPGIYDMTAEQGIDVIRSYAHLDIDPGKNWDSMFWSRGSLDQLCFDSLCKKSGGKILVPYSNWRDVRTAIDLIGKDAHGGYCPVPGFDRNLVVKHDPVHDCAYDIMMLLSPNLENENGESR